MSFDHGIYPEFVRTRTACMVRHFGLLSFKGKKVLEVGCGYGYAGQLLEAMGAIVTSSDARPEHLAVLNKRFPKRKTLLIDCNKDEIPGEYDLIVAFGLLYHLENPAHFIEQCGKAAKALCLCSIVVDSDKEICVPYKAETSFDQSMTNKSCFASPAWILKEIAKAGFKVEDISSSEANVQGNRFDWKPINNGASSRGDFYLRRMFAGEK